MILIGAGLGLLILGYLQIQEPAAPELSLPERCEEIGGEWVYQSQAATCLLATGQRLVYSLAQDEFLPQVGLIDELAVVDERPEIAAPLECSEELAFEDYLSAESYTGRVKVDFDTDIAARHYRTAITKDAARGVNFGGRYLASTWGCGQGCVGLAVINAETGKILSYGLRAGDFDFEPDSDLLKLADGAAYVLQADELVAVCAANGV